MLTLDIRRHGDHAQVDAHCAGTKVDLGFLNESQLELLRLGLAASLESLEYDLERIRQDAADRIWRKQEWTKGRDK